ncbi:MAG TPA: hypothetical protein DE179_04380 [Oceanospirillaceae bacterium]|nr:hypothetical protein [Oceanospirillaceae bacterium]
MNKIFVGALSASILVLGGAYYQFEYMPEVDPDFRNAPVTGMSKSKVTGKLPFTTQIANPAGISYNFDDNTYLVSTDDRVFAEVAADFTQVLSSFVINNKPYGTGDTEGVTYLGNGKAAAVGENGVVVLLSKAQPDLWVETSRFEIDGFNQSTQLGSAAYDPSTNTLYTAQKKASNKVLYAINLETQAVVITPLTLGAGIAQKPNGDWSDFYVAGLDFNKGKLHAVSEAFSSVITMDLNGVITAITGIEGLSESAGITHNTKGYVLIGDAEGYLPDPPIYFIEAL